ncbi:rho GTPase-activating protein 30 isoform X2 [Dromiciops gliroides]|uniref:rho GTPase-activating protein 30 isoform X2 n=1 Tax=Dromiciops gliroides TaxID=33562 RepID=UPI001CC79E01|nr:rho GTPase-activating protein 30 isoform X2 [Dromiciops gliroides]
MKSRQRGKKKGGSKERVFGCDLLEHLQLSGQEVPQVLRSCAEFVEEHGVVDGIYRLSGVSSNIQKLRQEFEAERRPDLRKDIYLQDIHCVSSLCKAYFRELPDPLLTYRLYDKFAEAVAVQLEPQRLIKIRDVLGELPGPHYRTLEYLMRHLVHMASFSAETNMHARNLAIVWAPNLLRSKDIEASGFNGTAAFMEVRVQSIVVEFILTHVDQLFGGATLMGGEAETSCRMLPTSRGTFSPEEPLSRHLSYHLPSVLQAGDGPPQIRPYHTIIEIGDHKRKGSLKVRKWKSIFNLGRSGNDTKRKPPRPCFTEEKSDKMSLRPAKSMDSLSAAAGASDEAEGLGKASSSRPSPLQLESLEDVSMATDGEREAEVEPKSGTSSEPGTPRTGRAGTRAPGCSRAERCAGVHISDPYNVNLPLHITSILNVPPNIISNMTVARLTRGLECPALQARPISGPSPSSGPLDEKMEPSSVPAPLVPNPESLKPDPTLPPVQEDSLSQEVQDSFSFLEDSGSSSEPEWAVGETRDAVLAEGACSTGEDDPNIGYLEELMGAGPQVEEFSVEPPLDDLSLDEALFVLAPNCCSPDIGNSEQEEDFGEDVFLSAYDDLSPLLVPEPQRGEDLGSRNDEADGGQTSSEDGGERAYKETGENKMKESERVFETKEEAEGSQEPEARVDREKGREAKRNEKEEVEEVKTKEQKEAEEEEEVKDEEELRGEKTEGEEKPGGIAEVEHEENIAEEEKTKNQDKTGIESQVEDEKIGGKQKADGENTEGQQQTSRKEEFRGEEEQVEVGNNTVGGEVKSQSHQDTERNGKTLDNHKVDEKRETKAGEESGWRNKESGERQEDRKDRGSLECDAVAISGKRECGDGEADQEARVDSLSGDLDQVVPWRSSNVKGHDANPPGVEVVPQSPRPEDREPEGQTTLENCVLYPCAPSSSVPLPEPAGSVSMRLASTLVQVQQVRSVPVVPPKPQFAKMPSTLGSKIHVAPANPCPRPGRLDGTPGDGVKGNRASRSSWRNGGSLSFDAAVALARERQKTEAPVIRRTHTCIGGGDGSLLPSPSASILPPASVSRPLSCLEAPLPAQEGAGPRIRHSLPPAESQPLNTVILPQRRTYAFEAHAGLGEGEGL